MVTPWVLIAAFVGGKAASAKMAGVWGVTSLVTATVTYYIIAALDRELVTMKYFLIWTVLSLIVGSLFGAIGWETRTGPTWWRICGAAVLASVPIAESIVLWAHVGQLEFIVTCVITAVVGVLLPFVLLRDLPVRARSTAFGGALVISAPLAVLFDFAFHQLGILGV